MINFPENHWTLKAKWMLLKFTGTSPGTHIPKDGKPGKIDYTDFNES